jgi:hypothetical protein
MEWEKTTIKKFELMVSKMPLFHRRIAQIAVSKKAEENAELRGSQIVKEQDVISAFFSEVPAQFYSMMVRLLEHTGFNYKKYGFPK